MKHFITYFDSTYCLKAMALYLSLLRNERDFRLIILPLDEYAKDVVTRLPKTELLRLDDLPRNILDLRASLSHTEWCWKVAPFVCGAGLEYDSLTYVDADCFVMGSLDEVYHEIGGDTVAITPHRFATEHKWREESNGTYNVGVVYFANVNSARACIEDWKQMTLAGQDDQRCWNTLVPNHKVHVIPSLGCDLAPWNFGQYAYRTHMDAIWVSDGVREDRLSVFHAHELQHDDEGNITRMTNWKIPEFVVDNIYSRYQVALRDARRFLR